MTKTGSATPAGSYSSTRLGLLGRLTELRYLYRAMSNDLHGRASEIISEVRAAEDRVRSAGGPAFTGLRILDVGPGQQLGHFLCLGVDNEATGIDLDTNPQGCSLPEYWQLLRSNGPMRLVKTVARKLLGFDRRLRSELSRQLAKPLSQPDLRQMDATRMTFADATFDLVYSRSVLEHVERPREAMTEIRRVLRPGGAAHLTIHSYTSDSGCHDPRILSGRRGSLPYWPHLRASSRHLVIENSYLNKLRLAEWESLVQDVFPGAVLDYGVEEDPARLRAIEQARTEGELVDYEDRELLTHALHVVWLKA